jgi:hypothetical protein
MKSLVAILSIILLASCGSVKKVPFTHSIKAKYSLDTTSLRSVQFFISETVILTKSEDAQGVFTSNGVIVLSDENYSEQITIVKGTPCVFEKQVSDSIYLFRFEDGIGRVLPFGVNGDTYTLLAKNWNDGVGYIKYAGKNYTTTNGNAHLTVVIRRIKSGSNKQKVLTGKTI